MESSSTRWYVRWEMTSLCNAFFYGSAALIAAVAGIVVFFESWSQLIACVLRDLLRVPHPPISSRLKRWGLQLNELDRLLQLYLEVTRVFVRFVLNYRPLHFVFRRKLMISSLVAA